MEDNQEVIHETLPLGLFECNCTILGDPESRRAVIFDPGDEVERILAVLARHRLELDRILLTHAHIDHVGAVAPLKREFGVDVWMHAADQGLYDRLDVQAGWAGMPTPERVVIDRYLEDNETLQLLGLEIHVLHTPGHSPGSVSFYLPSLSKVISGDALFRNSIGRTDLPGGNHEQLIQAIQTRLLTLPDDTGVYPGHGPSTTIGFEKRTNPFLQGVAVTGSRGR